MVSASVELQKVQMNPCMCPQQGLSAVNENNAGGHLSLQDHQSGVMRRGQMFIGQPMICTVTCCSSSYRMVVCRHMWSQTHQASSLYACTGMETEFCWMSHKSCPLWRQCLLIESEITLDVNQFKLHISWHFPAIQWKGSGHQLQFWLIRVWECVRVVEYLNSSTLPTFPRNIVISPRNFYTHQNNLAEVEPSGPGQTHKFMIQVQHGFTQGFLVNDAV